MKITVAQKHLIREAKRRAKKISKESRGVFHFRTLQNMKYENDFARVHNNENN